MSQLRSRTSVLRLSAVDFLPFVLWVPLWLLLWLGLEARPPEAILGSDGPVDLINHIRGALPLWAGGLAVIIFIFKVSRLRNGELSLFGPLGFATVYGLVGLTVSFLSPDGSVALYWAALYISVPLVLWGIVWGRDGLGTIHRIINLNWLIVILGTVVLFVVALLYLDLGSVILSPSDWFDCSLYKSYRGQTWHDLTGGILRPTGVGRYAALTAILAIGGLWSRSWRSLWALILLVSLILLLTSGRPRGFCRIWRRCYFDCPLVWRQESRRMGRALCCSDGSDSVVYGCLRAVS